MAVRIIVLCAAIIIAFHQILSIGFVCDDYLHLPYLMRAQTDPGLLWANFVGPWIGETNLYLFYRPLTEISLFIDWMLFGADPRGFHLTAMILHAINAILLMQIYATISQAQYTQISKTRAHLPAFFAALLWALDPMACESLGWVMSRSDLVCTMFYLAAMLVFIKGERPKNKAWATVFLVIAMLCKEMAVTLPAVLLLWLLYVKKLRWRVAICSLGPMIAATIVYVLARALAIQDLIGGYVGSTGAMLSKSALLRWFGAGSIWHLFYPLSREVFAQQDPLRLALKCIYASLAMLLCWGKKYAPKTAIFCLIWFVLTLAPNWQNWLIDDTMCGARIAYLPTMGFYGALVYCIWPATRPRTWQYRFAATILTVWAISYAMASMTFIKTWQAAADEMQAVQADLIKMSSGLQNKQRLIALGLPYMHRAAFQANTRAEIKNLLEPPLNQNPRSQGITQKIFAPDFTYLNSPHFPCEIIDELARDPDHETTICLYDPILRRFCPMPEATSREPLQDRQPIILDLKREVQTGGILYTARLTRPMPVSSVLRIEYRLDGGLFSKAFYNGLASIYVTTPEAAAHLNERQRAGVLVDLVADGKPHVRDIDLGSYKSMRWQSDISTLCLLTHTENASLEITRAQLIPRAMAMPVFRPAHGFEGRVFEATPLAQTYDETIFPLVFDYDATKTKTKTNELDLPARLICQISRPHHVFAEAQTFNTDAVDVTIALSGLRGRLTIDRGLLTRILSRTNSGPSLRQIRLVALDAQGRQVSYSTAYTIISR